jgi:Transglycosylase
MRISKKTKKRIYVFTAVFICVILIAIGCFLHYRDGILQKAIQKATVKFQKEYDSKLTLQKAYFDGFTEVGINQISLVPNNKDTLFRFEKIKTSISIWNLFKGKILLSKLETKNGFVQLIKKDSTSNFQAFLPKKKTTANTPIKKRNYAQTVYELLNKGLDLIPTDMVLENFNLFIDNKGKKSSLSLDKLVLDDEELETTILFKNDDFSQKLKIIGTANPRDREADIQFYNGDKGKIIVPYLDEKYNLKSSFDLIRIAVSDIDMDGDELQIEGSSTLKNFTINHPKVATKDVLLKDVQMDYNLIFGENFISLDKSSEIQFNKIKCNPFISLNTEKDKTWILDFSIPNMKAQDFVSSLPSGLFSHFQGMKILGEFEYNLKVNYNEKKPYLLKFDSKLNDKNLKVVQFGTSQLNKLNTNFEYRAIIKDVPQRPILVGPENPKYTPLDRISPYLMKSVFTTEDPSFMKHHGFINESFRKSIIENIKTKKFTRGASTISMQLVKNVFLTREKTLSRKLEEILLVAVMENARVVSKKRLLEVYFNIIEWGPDVYGIGEASMYYFQKKPADLSLSECLYLATIIPSPRKFMTHFNDQGDLNGRWSSMNRYIRKIMVKRGIISESESYLGPVYISGRARSQIRIVQRDTITIEKDSISIPEESEFEF